MPRKALAAVLVALTAVLVLVYAQRQPNKGLQYVAVGIDENRSPVALGIKVRNDSRSDVKIVDCFAELQWTSLVAGRNMPDRFSSETTFHEKPPIVIPANSQATVILDFRWTLPSAAPPAVAACQIVPGLKTEDGTLSTEPVTFIVTHNSDDETIRAVGGFRIDASEAGAREFLETVERLPGKKSKRVQYLMRALREQLAGKAKAPVI